MSVCLLVPCLMLENNRDVNRKRLAQFKALPVDEIVVNAQEFQPEDYIEGITYIGRHDKRCGFVAARNELLRWFFNSDYDWAVWLDANASVGKYSINAFSTVVSQLNTLSIDAIISSLGIIVCADRIWSKQQPDYQTHVKLLPVRHNTDWFHGLFMRNFNKYYGEQPLISDACDVHAGTAEDIMYIRLLRKVYDCRYCPDIIISKPSNKTSTWLQNSANYDYPVIQYSAIHKLVDSAINEQHLKIKKQTQNLIRLERVAENQEFVVGYKPKSKLAKLDRLKVK